MVFKFTTKIYFFFKNFFLNQFRRKSGIIKNTFYLISNYFRFFCVCTMFNLSRPSRLYACAWPPHQFSNCCQFLWLNVYVSQTDLKPLRLRDPRIQTLKDPNTCSSLLLVSPLSHYYYPCHQRRSDTPHLFYQLDKPCGVLALPLCTLFLQPIFVFVTFCKDSTRYVTSHQAPPEFPDWRGDSLTSTSLQPLEKYRGDLSRQPFPPGAPVLNKLTNYWKSKDEWRQPEFCRGGVILLPQVSLC